MAEKIRAAMAGTVVASKRMTVTVEGKDAPEGKPAPAQATAITHSVSPSAKALANQRYSQARAAAVSGHSSTASPGDSHAGSANAHGGEAHWAYEGETGPQAWGNLKPEFNVCAIGKRQSPINIESGSTLQGPAEPVQFAYVPSNASVVNNGHTIQVDVQGDNSITVRGSNYRLLQLHFHTPSEEQINFKRFPMVAHLVHKNNDGQLAVVAVLLQEGESNAMIDKVWTYMPLDSGDRVRMPQGLLDVNELLPKDQRYYQFMGSLTTPPCTEGVLWMVLKQPVTLSKAQYKLFTQIYPNNARPVQDVNGRPVREAQ
jgi:carbonic anhydrase